MRIGFHFPFSGGLIKLKERISASRGNTFQIFARSLRGGNLQNLKEKNLLELLMYVEVKNIKPSIVHAPYIYNLANEETDDVAKIAEDLEFAKKFRAPYYIMHPGYHTKQHPLIAMEYIKSHLLEVVDSTDWLGEILIKNMRGAGTEMGWDLRDWNELISFHPQIKGALDLARAYGAGYDFTSRRKAEEFYQYIEDTVGWDKIKVIYVNDYAYPLGARREDKSPPPLGEGTIGFKGYQYLLEKEEIRKKIWIVENQPDSSHYRRSLDYLLRFHRRG